MEISLFVPYFRPKEAERRRELLVCLEQNRRSSAIGHLYLMIDDDAEVSTHDGRVTVIPVERRPTYSDWVSLSAKLCPQAISVLANADIYFDDSLSELVRLFEADPTAFVALSRHDLLGGETVLHPNPHWSQDVWAFLPHANVNPARDAYLNFPLGVPRCDNKAAYVFGVSGHTVYNPCREVRAVHVHETGIRNYDKKGDVRVVGAVAMVHPSDDLLTPARLDIEVWPVNNADQFVKVSVNPSLEKWALQAAQPAPVPAHAPALARPRDDQGVFREPGVVGYDAHWQFPAITEKQAFEQVRLFAPRGASVVYLGFPWATLIDVKHHNAGDTGRLRLLEDRLAGLAELASGYERVITACQQIRMLRYPELFSAAGVTDIFWSHAALGQDQVPGSPEITLHPLPLYPVQIDNTPEAPIDERRLLFSFVGSRASEIYLSQARTYLIEELSGDPRGLIIDRASWHYQRIVYDAQVLARAEVSDGLVDRQASEEFRLAMSQTKFALCPSGTGPNTIRLWEAVMSGAIPVVLAETYRPPGDRTLWERATISCGEDRESIRALPDRLEAIAADPAQMRRRRAALRVLALRYGRDNLASDVLAFMHAFRTHA